MNRSPSLLVLPSGRYTLGAAFAIGLLVVSASMAQQPPRLSFADVNSRSQPKMVKIFGAGGFRSLEAYQSGFFVSDQGHILTAFSYVLDTEGVTAVLHDGQRYEATLLGADPYTEVALLKIDVQDVDHFVLDAERSEIFPGQPILAFSNLYGIAAGREPVSIQRGHVATIAPLDARRGAFSIRYGGDVLVLDAITNNAGAAGGALTDRQGRLLGMLGKEVRDAATDAWLNYALPIPVIRDVYDQILSGKLKPHAEQQDPLAEDPWTLARLGMTLVPNVLPTTPPFVEIVRPGSPAEKAGLRPDDLIVTVNAGVVSSRQQVEQALLRIDRLDPIQIGVLRDRQFLELQLTDNN